MLTRAVLKGRHDMKEYDIIIAGGCASGLAAAISAARTHPGKSVAVLEKLPRAGKKLLATGNGRCNLSNVNALSHPYRNAAFASHALGRYNVERTLEFFASLGLLTYTDSEGRVYPASNTAASVLDALRFAAAAQGIEIICEKEITDIIKSEGKFVINGEYKCNRLVASLGGKAAPVHGTNGSGYTLMRSLGHSVTRLYPALSPLNAQSSVIKSLKGVRVHSVKLTAMCGEKTVAQSKGEILFTEYGISGIAAMELSAELSRAADNNVKQKCFTDIDFAPDMTDSELADYLAKVKKIKGLLQIDNLLTGILPKALGIAICKAIDLYTSGLQIKSLSNEDIRKIASCIKKMRVPISGAKGFDAAQVTSGGIDVREINENTLESKLCPGLYLAGEIIDVDGGCGGYNLQWAWSSGLLAGELGGDNN